VRVFRYKYCWLPLLAKHTESPVTENPLVVPLDCEWIWHCHRLNPVSLSTVAKITYKFSFYLWICFLKELLYWWNHPFSTFVSGALQNWLHGTLWENIRQFECAIFNSGNQQRGKWESLGFNVSKWAIWTCWSKQSLITRFYWKFLGSQTKYHEIWSDFSS